MNKIESVIELYKSVFPDVKVEKKGTWIRVYETDGTYKSYYSDEIISEIFNRTGNVYRWDGEYKTLDIVAAHADSLWDTGDSWNTNLNDWESNRELVRTPVTVKEPEEENLFDDIGEI